MEELTEKQKAFCEEYLIDLNATQAAIRAGYSEKTANRIASENLSKLGIQEYISELQNKRQKRTQITADMVIQELAKLAFSDIRDLHDESGKLLAPYNLPDSVASSISSFKSRREYQGKDEDGNAEYATIDEYKRYDKTKALELLGRHFGIFEKQQKQDEDNQHVDTQINIIRDK